MKVCLVGLIAGGYSGVPRYAALLTRALDRTVPEFPSLRLTLATTAAGLRRIQPRNLEIHVPRQPLDRFNAGPKRILAEQLVAALQRADLLHFFDLTAPLLAPDKAFVATAHDARSAYGPNRRRWAYKRHLHPWALGRATAVVADSQFTKDEIQRGFAIDHGKVQVVYPGPGLELPAEPIVPETAAASPYLLFIGALEPNKNLPLLVDAFGRSGVDVELLLVGKPGGEFRALQQAIDASPVRHRVRLIHDAGDAEADRLYRGALALVLPSTYEGFGFTALEAMARDCPVLASDIPALREVAGRGALLLPPHDADAWSDAIRRVINDESLRVKLREQGAAAVSRYSWDETARRICRLFLALDGTR